MLEILNKKKNILNILFYILVFLIIILGVFIRAKFYFEKLPMWVDEIMLASSFTDRSFCDLFKPLDAFQKAPPLFFIIVLTIRKIFGANELTLRLLPFLTGIASIPAFYFLLKDNIKNKTGILAGLFMFTFCIPLIYFSAEFKPYGCDAFICILLFLAYKWINIRDISIKQTFLYTISTIFIIFTSFPSIFIIPALVLSKLIKEKKFDKKIIWVLAGILFAGLFLFLYDYNTYKFLNGYWGQVEHGFHTFPTPKFIWTYINDACCYYIYHFNLNLTILITFILIAGFLVLFKDKKEKAIAIILIILFALVSSSVNAYPLKPKLAMYMLPLLILIISKLYDISELLPDKRYKIISDFCLCGGLILLLGINIPYINMNKSDLAYYNKVSNGRNKSVEDRNMVKEFSLKILQNYKPNEKVLASEEFVYAIKCYKYFYKFGINPNITSFAGISENKISDFEMDKITEKIILDSKRNNTGIWIIGRDNEYYFKCPNLKNIIAIADINKTKYEINKYKDIYLIHITFDNQP